MVTGDKGPAALLPRLAGIYVAFLIGTAVIGLAIARWWRLPRGSTLALVFSLGRRNSFVVLPFALALPFGFEIAVVAVVFQSLIELFGMIAYLKLAPRWVPEHPAS